MSTATAEKKAAISRQARDDKPVVGPARRWPIVNTSAGNFVHLPLARVMPDLNQPRHPADNAELLELADSIRVHGVIEPIVVRPAPDSTPLDPRFLIIVGERRFHASLRAGQETIPAVVRPCDEREALELQLVENLQRQDFTPLEEAAAYARLTKWIHTAAIAYCIGKSLRHVQARLQLLTLEAPVQEALKKKTIAADTALQLAALPKKEQSVAVERIKFEAPNNGGKVSVRDAKRIIQSQRSRAGVAAATSKAQTSAPRDFGDCLAGALNQGTPFTFPKGANAIRVTWPAKPKIILKEDVLTAGKGVGLAQSIVFGFVPSDHKRRPQREKFTVIKVKA